MQQFISFCYKLAMLHGMSMRKKRQVTHDVTHRSWGQNRWLSQQCFHTSNVWVLDSFRNPFLWKLTEQAKDIPIKNNCQKLSWAIPSRICNGQMKHPFQFDLALFFMFNLSDFLSHLLLVFWFLLFFRTFFLGPHCPTYNWDIFERETIITWTRF